MYEREIGKYIGERNIYRKFDVEKLSLSTDNHEIVKLIALINLFEFSCIYICIYIYM